MPKPKISLIAVIILMAVSLAVSIINYDYIFNNPLDTSFVIENATRISQDSGGNSYVIFDSSKKIARINSSGRVDFILEGNSDRPGRFAKAWDITCDASGNLYVLDYTTDDSGIKVDMERISVFGPDGAFSRTVYTCEYREDKPDMEGNFRRIRVSGDKILFYYTDNARFQIGSIGISSGEKRILKDISADNPKLNIVDCDFSDGLSIITYITKKGQILLSTGGSVFREIYTSSMPAAGDSVSIPWQVSVSGGSIYFSDAGTRRVVRMTGASSGYTSVSVSGDCGGIIRSFQVSGVGFIAVTDTATVRGDFSGGTVIDDKGKTYSAGIILQHWFISICGLSFILSIVLLLSWIYVYAFGRKISEVLLQSAMIVFIVFVTTSIVLQVAITTLTGIYRENTFSNLKYISQLSKKYIDGDLAARIQNREDFMNSDYVKLRDQLHSVFNDNNDDWNADYYGGLYSFRENRIYVLMFFDDSSGVNFPYRDDYRDSPFASVIEKGEFVTVEENDVYGSWIYALSPVYDSKGRITAVLEVGKDLNRLQEQIKEFITGITKEIITILVILVLVMLELTIFRDILHRRDKKGYGEGFGEFGLYSVHTVRMLAFIIAFSYALPVCYTPLMMKEILARTGTSILGLPGGIAMAIPISAEMLGTALFAVIAGHLVENRGWKRPFIYGSLIMSAGAFTAYYTSNPYLFILARFLVGSAYGLALVTLQCYPMISSSIETRNSGLASQNSGLNAGYCCGVAIGGLCADYMGYSTVYIFSVLTALAAIPYARYLMSSSLTSGTGPGSGVHTIDILKFFTDRNVFLFFTAAFIPVSICSMFLTYMFPVFAQEKGISAGDIGRVFMLNSLVIIYMGPAVVNLLTKRKFLRGKYTMALYMLVTLTGLLIFGFKPAVITAVVIILFVGLGDSFGLPMSNDYLIGLKASAKIGYDKSVGYLNFIGNIGQMIGPVLMGYLFTMGYQKGTYAIMAGMTAAMFIFFIFSRNEAQADE